MEKLGIQPIHLLAQIFNFVLLLFILKKFLYKPILKMLDERQKKVKEGLEYAEKMKAESEQSEKRREQVQLTAKNEAKEIVAAARKEAKKMADGMVQEAEKEARSITEKARNDAAKEYEVRLKELEKEAVSVASRMVERLLKDALSAKEQKDIITNRLKAISRS